MFREVSHIDEIIVIRAADPDGSLFQTLMDALKKKDFTLAVTLETEHLSKLKYEADSLIEANPGYFITKEKGVFSEA